jgi:hypothetical protein
MLTRMVEAPNGVTTAMIEAVRQELSHFQSRQRDAAVLFRCAAIDVYLAGALQGRDDPWLRTILARDVEKLAQALRNAHHSGQRANEVETRPNVRSVMIEALDSDFADGSAGVA